MANAQIAWMFYQVAMDNFIEWTLLYEARGKYFLGSRPGRASWSSFFNKGRVHASSRSVVSAMKGPTLPLFARELVSLSPRHWYLITVAFAVQSVDGFDLMALSFAGKSIASAWNLSSSRLGILLSAAQFGSLFGLAAVGLAAKHLPRKGMLLAAVVLVGLSSLATAFASGFAGLLVCRVIAGVGLGAMVPLIIAHAAELSPIHVRGSVSGLVVAGVQTGIILGGLVAAALLPVMGWQSLFVVGALAPAALLPLIAFLPPSPVDLVRKGAAAAQVETLCTNYDIELPGHRLEGAPLPATEGLSDLSRSSVLPLTASCISMMLSALAAYFLYSWTPTVLQDDGMSIQVATLSLSFVGIGAIAGILVCSRLMDRKSPYLVIGFTFLAAAILLGLMVLVSGAPAAVFIICFLVGATILGGNGSHYAFSNLMFPSHLRLSIMALLTGLGRLAGLAAPVGAGFLMTSGLDSFALFMIAAILALISALAMLIPAGILKWGHARRTPASQASRNR